jgi:hypothetical protein
MLNKELCNCYPKISLERLRFSVYVSVCDLVLVCEFRNDEILTELHVYFAYVFISVVHVLLS